MANILIKMSSTTRHLNGLKILKTSLKKNNIDYEQIPIDFIKTKLDLQYELIGALCGDIQGIQNETYMCNDTNHTHYVLIILHFAAQIKYYTVTSEYEMTII